MPNSPDDPLSLDALYTRVAARVDELVKTLAGPEAA